MRVSLVSIVSKEVMRSIEDFCNFYISRRCSLLLVDSSSSFTSSAVSERNDPVILCYKDDDDNSAFMSSGLISYTWGTDSGAFLVL